MPTQKIQPQTLFQRALGGHVLYNHVVVVEAQHLIFISGQLARNKAGEIVGPRDLRAQIKQVGENLRNALEERPAARSQISSRPRPSSPISTSSFVTSTFATTILASHYRPRPRSRSVG
jgi:enamine deaminase RidA (YjgF/YER057c/UK114 family)